MTDQHRDTTSINDRVIEEFRSNGGRLGGAFEGAPIALLTTHGAKSGGQHTTPAVYAREDDRILVFASNAGGPKNPDWYHNLLADPRVSVEIGQDGEVVTIATEAVPLEGAERDRAYAEQAAREPRFADYAARTDRTIPVVALYPVRFDDDPERNKAIGAQLVQVHNELRAELRRVREEVDAHPNGGVLPEARLGTQLFGHCLTFCEQLHAHHTGEDGAFAALEQAFPALASPIDRLRREHRVVADSIGTLRQLLDRPIDEAGFAAFRAEIDRLTADIEDHFAYEEEQILPALTGSASSVR